MATPITAVLTGMMAVWNPRRPGWPGTQTRVSPHYPQTRRRFGDRPVYRQRIKCERLSERRQPPVTGLAVRCGQHADLEFASRDDGGGRLGR